MALREPDDKAWDYNVLEMHMKLKHKETGDLAVLHGWGDKKNEPWLELYFLDKEPADKNADRAECYGWRRMSMWMTMDGKPLFEKAEPFDPETAKFRKKMEDAVKQGAGEAKGGADDAKTKKPESGSKEPEPAKSSDTLQMADTLQMPEADTLQMADTQLPADDDVMQVDEDEPPAKSSKKGPGP